MTHNDTTKKVHTYLCTLLAKLAIELSDATATLMLFMFKILMSCLPYQWYVCICLLPTTII